MRPIWPFRLPYGGLGPDSMWAGHIGSAMGLNTIANPLGPSIYGDHVHSPGYLGGVQVGVNWQATNSIWVVGLEADASLANLDGTNTCYAVSGVFNS